MIFISSIEREILVSYLDEFGDSVDDEDIDEFKDVLLSLYDKKMAMNNSLDNLEKSNDKLESFIRDFKDKLNVKLNNNQKLLEDYNSLIEENNGLNRINEKLSKSNENLDEKIRKINDDSLDYKKSITTLKEDIAYYERILKKLTIIINSLDDDTYTLNESLNIDRIESSPYYRLIEESGLFDRKYYNNMYLDDESVDEVAHYIRIGSYLDYNPNDDFDSRYYRNEYLDGNKTINPLVEYLSITSKEARLTTNYSQMPDVSIQDSQEYRLLDESGLFDEEFYRKNYEVDDETDALSHYMRHGCSNKYKPSEDFDIEWYNDTYTYYESSVLLDYVLNSSTRMTKKADNKYSSYEEYDIKDSQLYNIINDSNMLDVSWYFMKYNTYQDDLIEDYLLNASETRYLSQAHYDYIQENPESDVYHYIYQRLISNDDWRMDYSKEPKLDIKDSIEYTVLSEDESFDKKYYLESYGDVKRNALDPVYHYIAYGINEGRNPNKDFDTDRYYRINFHIKNRVNPLVDYIYKNKDDLYDDDIKTSLQDTMEYAILDDEKYFDSYYYQNEYDIDAGDLLKEYMEYGFYKGRNPTRDIDINKLELTTINDYADYVISRYQRIDEVKNNYLKDYEDNYNLLKDSIYFDEDYYIRHNPHITGDADAIEYYLESQEYYPTSRYIDLNSYLESNQDLSSAGVDALIHFIKYGLKEGRPYKRPKLSMDDFEEYPHLYELYDIIYESGLFDESYYMKRNPELLESGEDSIIHYLKHGVDMDLDPSAIFSTKRYLKYNPDIKRTGFNPLYHYLKRGINENRFMFLPDEYYPNNILERNDYDTTARILDHLKEKTTIILPVNQDINQFKITLQSIVENTQVKYELLLVNNITSVSGDNKADIRDELERLDLIEDFTVIDSTDSMDKIILDAMKKSTSDVVYLDSDTILTPHWLVKLTSAAYSNRKAACISALTNNTDLLTQENKDKLSRIYDIKINNIDNLNDKSRQVQEKLNLNYIPRKSCEKYCIYIKRDALDDVICSGIDSLDDLADYFYNKGYISFTDSSTLVYTTKSQSNEFVTNKYNDVNVSVVNDRIESLVFDNKRYERILCFTQMNDGQPVVDKDIRQLSNKYDTYILAIDDDKIYLFKYSKDYFALIDNIKTDYSYDTNFFYRIYLNILINLKVDLIYTKTHKRLFHPTNRKFTSILEFAHHFEAQELHETLQYDKSFMEDVEGLLKTHHNYEDIISGLINRIRFDDCRMVVYTAVTGSYDEPVIPSYVNENFDYICFTDNPDLTSDFWDIRLMEDVELDDIRKVRRYKILAHKYLSDYDYSLWIDTNIELTDNIIDYVHKYSKNNKLLAIKHIERDCIYDEAVVCISSAKDRDIEVINSQIEGYKKQSYPEHNGLISSGVLFRSHNNPEVVKLMEDWFDELLKGSFRDQLSFNYVCWKNNFKYDAAPLFIIKNAYMQLHDHMSKGYVLRNINIEYGRDYDLKYDVTDVDVILDAFNKVSIIMAVNDYDTTIESIDYVTRYTGIDYELLLVSDNNNVFYKLVDKYSSSDKINVIYSASHERMSMINTAINHSSNDILLIDENVRLSPKYIQKLIIKAYSHEMIATVSPITNHDLCKVNSNDSIVPQDIFTKDSLITTSKTTEEKARDAIIMTPLFNKSCVFIKRDALYMAGFFDVEYDTWEYAVMDYSLRLLKKGWHNVIAPSAYVYSDVDSSIDSLCDILLFKKKSSDLSGENNPSTKAIKSDTSDNTNIDYAHDKKILLTRYYEYKNMISEFKQSIEYNNIKRLIRYGLVRNDSRKRILYVLHDGIGGTLHTNLELMKNVNKYMESYLLVTSTTKVELYRYNPHIKDSDTNPDMEFKQNLDLLRTWKLNGKYTLLNTSNDRLRQIYFNILIYLNVDIIHIRHLILSTFDLPKVAGKLGIPVILSFHDYYYICPSHNLVDDNKNYCGGICPPLYADNSLGGQCNIIADLNIPQARTIVHWWQDEVAKLFEDIQAFITTSKSAYDLYTKHYPQLKERDFRIIEHGRDLKTPDSTEYVTPINSNRKIKILFPGHIGYTKGYELIKKIKEYDTKDKLEFHYMGSIGGHTDLEEIGVNHGVYKRSEFSDIVHRIKPHFIGIFSIWPETYCHTLTEGWASGIPILAVNIGAVSERIKINGGGFLINNNPKEAYEKIIKISHNRRMYMKKAARIPQITFKTTEEMAKDYLEVYGDYLNY